VANIRRIDLTSAERHFYLLDACFLANKYIPVDRVTDPREKIRVERSKAWWQHIDAQVRRRKAIVYVPDVCIAEAFKVLAKKYYRDKYFRRPVDHKIAREKLAADLHATPRVLKSSDRHIRFHDISTSRDIIIAVDRFFEVCFKRNLEVSVPDLIILATAKYLVDFYNIPNDRLHIVTLDHALWRASKLVLDIPSAFNPNMKYEQAHYVFQ